MEPRPAAILQFMATGDAEVKTVMDYLTGVKFQWGSISGCGVGRLTQMASPLVWAWDIRSTKG
jgi:hypothetical protein